MFLNESAVRCALPDRYKNNKIYVYDSLDSTNSLAKELAVDGTTHGTVVLARQQTSGKGRLGRSFFSPKDGIYLSIIIKPEFDLTKSVLVTAAAAVSTAEAIQEVTGHETAIKWVNDVYINDKKVCGILTEGVTNFDNGKIDHIVIGIGINTSDESFPQELAHIAGTVDGDYSRSELAASVITKTLDLIKDISSRTFINAYKSKSLVIGKTVTVHKGIYIYSPDEVPSRRARVLDIDNDGGLVVIYTDGSRETLTSGEISIRL